MVNPVTLEVVRNALIAYADEMATVLCRTAYNMMIFEVRDYCVGLVDAEGNIIAQNTGGLPIFLADLGAAIKGGIETHGRHGFKPGDVILSNDPLVCGQHLNNVVVYTPFFYDGKLVAFPSVRAHWIDVGGGSRGFGSTATREIYEEGLQLCSIKIYDNGKPNQEALRVIRANIRFPESSFGDLRAQIAACRIGERRLNELFDKYGMNTVLECIRISWDQAEQLARLEVERIPDGVYEAESFLDSDFVEMERRVPIKVRVMVQGDEMTVDYSDIADQTRGPINSGISGGIAAARVAFKCVTSPLAPVNEGGFRPLKVILPPGKFLSARPPAPIGGWSISLPTVIETILKALAHSLPDKIPAGHKGDMGGYTFYGVDHERKRPFICMNIFGGGWGGKPFEDGENAAVSICQGNVQNAPVELQEAYYPVMIQKHELRADSGGAGKYRGGLGVEMVVCSYQDIFLNTSFQRTLLPPWGLHGGLAGAPNEAHIIDENGDCESVAVVTNFAVKPGNKVVFRSGGGGGYGNPLDRDPAVVRMDVMRGYVSAERALKDYGVVIDPETMEVDAKATESLRDRRAAGVGG